MLHRGVKFAHAVILAFSALFSFLFLKSFEDRWVLGYDAVVRVTETRDASTSRAVVKDIGAFARDHGVTVGRQQPDLEHPDRRRHLYLTADGPRADWLDGGYPAFSPGQTTVTHALSDIADRDPRGLYYLYGDSAAVEPFMGLLKKHGFTASVVAPASTEQLSFAYGDSALAGSLIVVALVLVTVTGAGVLLNAKSYGVLRLHGLSLPSIFARDLRRLVRFWAAALSAVTVASTALLAWYNHLAWFWLFALLTAATAAVFTLLTLAAHAGMLALTARSGILAALKGEFPARSTAAAAYLVRIPAMLLALGIAAAVVQAGQDLGRREDALSVYEQAQDTSSIRLNGYLGAPDSLRKLEAKVGTWLRQSDADGQLILAGREDIRRSRDGQHIPAGALMVVNETFLEHQEILDGSGRRVPADTGGVGEVLLLVPQHLAAYADRLESMVPSLVSPSDPDRVTPEHIGVLPTEDQQRLFTYNARGTYQPGRDRASDESYLTDPVVIVVPNGTEYISDKGYTAYASQRSILFPDPADITAGIEARGLHNEVIATTPVAADAAQAIRDITTDFRLRLFNLAVALAVLLVTGVSVVIVHTRKNAQRIFARFIHGWTFLTTHRALLAAEAVVVTLLVTWIPLQVWQHNQDLEKYRTLGIPAPRPPMTITGLDLTVITGLVVVEITATLAVLAFFHRRIVKEGSTEA
ncbi:hypothetical protein G3I32_36020 [Streptomyces coelicoflavus]|uniref:DUF1430 domain-containing protein n=1 Tax=Streptomyces coelicoflavus TaxID=285562 RepID=A0A7K3PW02_9ACTN|nr:hypothetical protein [Streptomyces coelicoflavus]NEB14174.1 hypothetical protein [Streptomyces coelicoflavus]